MSMPSSTSTISSTSLDLAAWDRELDGKDANVESLYQTMLKASKKMQVESAEIWWRLARVTFLITFNFTYGSSANNSTIKEKTEQAATYAGKAILLKPNHFEANLWMAKCAGKVALIESDPDKQIQWVEAFLQALSVCDHQKPDDPWVLFLEGRLQFSLMKMSEEQKATIEKHVPLPKVNPKLAEQKLRKSIKLNTGARGIIAGYMTLALLMLELNNVKETLTVVEAGLAVERNTRFDRYLAEKLEKVKVYLLEEMGGHKGMVPSLTNNNPL